MADLPPFIRPDQDISSNPLSQLVDIPTLAQVMPFLLHRFQARGVHCASPIE